MEIDQNPARILKKISEALMPLVDINEEWEASWAELITALDEPGYSTITKEKN